MPSWSGCSPRTCTDAKKRRKKGDAFLISASEVPLWHAGGTPPWPAGSESPAFWHRHDRQILATQKMQETGLWAVAVATVKENASPLLPRHSKTHMGCRQCSASRKRNSQNHQASCAREPPVQATGHGLREEGQPHQSTSTLSVAVLPVCTGLPTEIADAATAPTAVLPLPVLLKM